jgi:hypothetical protein
MKKTIPYLLFALFTFACALNPLLPAVTPTPAPTQTDTATPLPTETPVLPTATFTLTPTLVGYKSPTPSPAATDTPTITPTSTQIVIQPLFILPTVKMEGFVSVTTSLSEIYKAKGCEPSTVRVTAQLSSMTSVEYVLLFVRFKSLKAERASKWTNIPMTHFGGGTYVYDLSSNQMLEDAYFETSWIEYQIVSTNKVGKEIGRTDIFKERLKMLECVPQPTATSPNVIP